MIRMLHSAILGKIQNREEWVKNRPWISHSTRLSFLMWPVRAPVFRLWAPALSLTLSSQVFCKPRYDFTAIPPSRSLDSKSVRKRSQQSWEQPRVWRLPHQDGLSSPWILVNMAARQRISQTRNGHAPVPVNGCEEPEVFQLPPGSLPRQLRGCGVGTGRPLHSTMN